MAANTLPIFEETPAVQGNQFTSADTTNKKDIWTPGADGSRIDMIKCITNDTAAVDVTFYINDGTTDFNIGNVRVPLGSGYTNVAHVDAMTTLSPTLGYLYIPAGGKLKAKCVATMTAAKDLDVVAMGGDY